MADPHAPGPNGREPVPPPESDGSEDRGAWILIAVIAAGFLLGMGLLLSVVAFGL